MTYQIYQDLPVAMSDDDVPAPARTAEIATYVTYAPSIAKYDAVVLRSKVIYIT